MQTDCSPQNQRQQPGPIAVANTGIPVAAEDTSNGVAEPSPTAGAVPLIDSELPAGTPTSMTTGACAINRPCAQEYVGKSQSCMF